MALDTASIEISRARRDALAKADELLWRSLQAGRPKSLDSYVAAKHRAMSRGFIYTAVHRLGSYGAALKFLGLKQLQDVGGQKNIAPTPSHFQINTPKVQNPRTKRMESLNGTGLRLRHQTAENGGWFSNVTKPTFI